MKELFKKLVDKIFGKRCKCAEKKPKQNYSPLECVLHVEKFTGKVNL